MNDVSALEEYGASLLQRKKEIAEKVSKSKRYRAIEFMGKMIDLPEIDLRIQMPVYRLANGRTRTMQLEYLALNPEAPKDLFTRDHDALEAQKAQHELLFKLANEENLFDAFKNDELQQTESIICTNEGVVVNGNRRLCVWRTLFYNDKKKYKSFETVRVAVLPDCDEKAIEDLEKKLQIQNQMRADYHWHTVALMAEEEIGRGVKDGEVAKSYEMSTQKLHLYIDAMHYASIYLEKTGHANQWSLVDKDYYAFEQMVKGRKKFTDQGDKELFEAICFHLIENGSEGRLYQVIQDVADNLYPIAEELGLKVLIDPDGPDDSTSEDTTDEPVKIDEGEIDHETDPEGDAEGDKSDNGDDDEDDLELLGGEKPEVNKNSQLAQAVTKTEDTGVVKTTVKNVIETQKALKSEKDASNYLMTQVSKAATFLQNAISNGFIENANTEGVGKQLDNIRERVNEIQKWIDQK